MTASLFVQNYYPLMQKSVDIYGNWTISEMNYIGLDIVDSRSLNYSQSNKYNFIHKGGL